MKLSMYTSIADQAFTQILRISVDNIFAQYRMLIITAFTFVFVFASIWDGEIFLSVRVCVY